MAIVRGRYISLGESAERRSRLEQHLQELGVAERYSWFPAIRGDAKAAATRSLRAGEVGLWHSWLQLLQEELKQPEQNYDWLHIVEDDAELSRPFLVFCERLKPDIPRFDLLFTDMYVNPSIHRSLAHSHRDLNVRGTIRVKTDLYTGCTASVMLHRKRIPAVLRCLKNCVKAGDSLIPLDNQLRRLFHQRQLSFVRTAPFITGVLDASIAASTIQQSDKSHRSVVLTQQICTNLRRQLSVLNSSNATHGLIKLMQELNRDRRYAQPSALETDISLKLMQLAESQDLFRYGLQPRLMGSLTTLSKPVRWT